MVELKKVYPVLPVIDLDKAVERFARLGFRMELYDGPDRYAFATRDQVELHLSEWAEHDPDKAGANIYLHVSDAEALHREWTAAGVEGCFSEPHDTPYGLREFGYVDPDGTLIRAGSRMQEENEARP